MAHDHDHDHDEEHEHGELTEAEALAEAERLVRKEIALSQIRQYGDPVLRMRAEEVEEFDYEREEREDRGRDEAGGVSLHLGLRAMPDRADILARGGAEPQPRNTPRTVECAAASTRRSRDPLEGSWETH